MAQGQTSFAIGRYGNPAHKPVGNLIVLNDDEIEPHTGFALHHHANIEIVTYVHDGTITHRNDQGDVGTIHAGDVQAMSAGTGIRHSERNDDDSPARLFQICVRVCNTIRGLCSAESSQARPFRWHHGKRLGATVLQQVRDALRRIDEGTFGRCVVDGVAIERSDYRLYRRLRTLKRPCDGLAPVGRRRRALS